MNNQEIEQLIKQPQETAKVDFKKQFYKIDEARSSNLPDKNSTGKWKEEREQQWAEFIKDIIAISNGNVGTADQTGYLIIGADDKLKSDGTPNLFNVDSSLPSTKEIIDKVSSYCSPKLIKIECETISMNGVKVFVVATLPTPYLYRLSKQLKTPKKEYSPHTVLVRRYDGEETYEASHEEQRTIEQEREALLKPDQSLNTQEIDRRDRVQKMTIEVYDRKIGIYRVVRDFLGLIQRDADVTVNDIFRFGYETDEALFLFDQEVEAYLKTIRLNATKLYANNRMLHDQNLPVGNRRTMLAQEGLELGLWFSDQYEVIKALFYQYVSL